MVSKIIFFGSGIFAKRIIEGIIENRIADIIAIVTTPHNEPSFNDFLENVDKKIDIIRPISLKDEDVIQKIRSISAQSAVVASYGKIIPQAIIDIFPRGIVNVHPSLLPAFRGPSPIQSVILKEEESTGISLIVMDREVDHGPIIAQEKIQIDSDDNYESLRDKLASVSVILLEKNLAEYIDGKLLPIEQDHEKATFTKKFSTNDGAIDKNNSINSARAKVKALSHNPGVFIDFNNKRIKILHTSIELGGLNSKSKPILVVFDGNLYLNLYDGLLKIDRLQPEGSRVMDARSFINGNIRLLE